MQKLLSKYHIITHRYVIFNANPSYLVAIDCLAGGGRDPGQSLRGAPVDGEGGGEGRLRQPRRIPNTLGQGKFPRELIYV
mgnify:FL=1